MQTPIPSPLRFPRKDLSSDKAIAEELTVSVSPTPATLFQRRVKLISKKYSHILVALRRQVDKVLQDIVPKTDSNATNDLIDDNLPRVVANVVKKEREASKATVTALIYKEFDDHVPKIIEELFKIYMKNNVINVHPTTSISTDNKFENSSAAVSSCRDDAFHKCDHDENQGDDGSPEGEKSAKRHKTSKGSKSAKGPSSQQPVQGSKTSASERQQQQE
ncbi:hypothetical protein Tco_1068754 [Tanacetum coccineum]|uniref:Uncharacterized protein n=1 Tax=Tanacetum coccineum TaxID=301880 RepID=A0ABQ5HIH5_9ASTR